jgi:hypothetical protein
VLQRDFLAQEMELQTVLLMQRMGSAEQVGFVLRMDFEFDQTALQMGSLE